MFVNRHSHIGYFILLCFFCTDRPVCRPACKKGTESNGQKPKRHYQIKLVQSYIGTGNYKGGGCPVCSETLHGANA